MDVGTKGFPGCPAVRDGGGRPRRRAAREPERFSRATVRAEYWQSHDADSRERAYSGYAGAKGLHAHLEYSKFWVSWFASPLAGSVSGGQRDIAFGFSYKFSSNLVAKIEGHDGEDFAILVPPPVRRYFLASLAASF
jgi:hypothetical protein